MHKNRINWVDVAKFFGIFAIYLGHFGQNAGLAYEFVFAFHVPLFFFLSGCVESLNKEQSISKNIIKKARTILLPLFIFATISIIMQAINLNLSISEVFPMIKELLKGCIRNYFVAGSLWFLSCLFVISVIFEVLKKVKNKCIIFMICLILYFIGRHILPQYNVIVPSLIFNIDSALCYIIFYSIGYICFEVINKIMSLQTVKYKIIFISSAIVALIYSACLFFEHDLLTLIPLNNIISPLLRPIIVSWFFICISNLCKNVDLFVRIGENTLYFCVSEFIVKMCVSSIVGILGFTINLSTPLMAYLYTFMLLLIVYKLFLPHEKKLLSSVNNIISLQRV